MKKTAGTLVLQSLLPLGDIIFIASAAFDQGWYQVGLAGRDGRDMWRTVGLKGKHGKKNLAAVLSMGFFEDNLP